MFYCADMCTSTPWDVGGVWSAKSGEQSNRPGQELLHGRSERMQCIPIPLLDFQELVNYRRDSMKSMRCCDGAG